MRLHDHCIRLAMNLFNPTFSSSSFVAVLSYPLLHFLKGQVHAEKLWCKLTAARDEEISREHVLCFMTTERMNDVQIQRKNKVKALSWQQLTRAMGSVSWWRHNIYLFRVLRFEQTIVSLEVYVVYCDFIHGKFFNIFFLCWCLFSFKKTRSITWFHNMRFIIALFQICREVTFLYRLVQSF